ncbi:MAG: fatty acyl-AMP ligase, partial [Anaerolineae bacterium]|nr:fatty acyl-AMP ligase [Anaerolineae bacterium]
PDLTLDDLSFIQYTSGSTAMPKGVMISYRNIIHNIYSIFDFRRHERSSESVYVNWAPIFHDMGLIMGVAQTAYDGIPTIMMTPVSFLQRPVRWLQAITDYKATISGGPNFAYDLCINKITPEERQTLDLSSWKIAFNGAEPVRPETLSRFVEVFGPHGFHPEALQPGYGMAETTLAVTGHYAKTPPVILPVNQDALEENRIVPAAPEDTPQLLVGCGPPLLDFEIAIVDPNTLEKCPPDHVGEIWLAADSVSVGYWERPEETKKTFQATIKDTGEGPFLRTGDLGFVRDNQLYITGRLKDMIIIKGRNYYPQDLELSAERSHPALEPGNGAAFSIRMDGTEQLIIVQEVKREARKNLDVQEVVNAIRKSIAKERGIRTYAVVLIRPHNVPKTSSGKIMRHESQNMFLKNEFEVIGEWRAPSQPPAK